uniref:ER membrane protein complex subunit 3 n=1 Tax=Macrostomum lignano TaxID=282301 RepID=A0A1I8FJ49_9PLAT
MAELLLDSAIRMWVFLPLVIITFLFGVIRHYVTILISAEKKAEPEQVSDQQVGADCAAGCSERTPTTSPGQAFASRKYYFNDPEHGFFKTVKTRKRHDEESMTDRQ